MKTRYTVALSAVDIRCLSIVALSLAVLVCPLRAQDYPTRPVRIVVTLPPASTPDLGTRVVADMLGKIWGQQVVVENKPGGGGAIGIQSVLSSPPDGYTLLSTVSSVFTVLPVQQKGRLAFDVATDLTPIALTGSEAMTIAVSPKLGVNTFDELVTRAKADPYKLIVGTNPAGSLPHLAAKMLVERTGAPMIVAPASGGTSEAIREIMGGHAHVVIEGRSGLKGALASGDLRAIAMMGNERLSSVPDVPALVESIPNMVVIGWTVVAVPKGTPAHVITRLSADLRKVVADPQLTVRAQIDPFKPLFGDDLIRFIRDDQDRLAPLVQSLDKS